MVNNNLVLAQGGNSCGGFRSEMKQVLSSRVSGLEIAVQNGGVSWYSNLVKIIMKIVNNYWGGEGNDNF